MIVLSNCLAEKTDEGCIKLAASLARRIKQRCPETLVVSCGNGETLGDVYVQANALLVSKELAALLQKRREEVLLVPAVAKALPLALRVFCLSRITGGKLRVLVAMRFSCDPLSRLLLRLSGAELITLSKQSCDYYRGIVGAKATQLKAGVDCQRFAPVSPEEKQRLRAKYGLPDGKPIVLHVGHLKGRRNLEALEAVDDRFHCVLVLSGYSPESREEELLHSLRQRENLTVIDRYLPDIQELYQLADVYLFPVKTMHGCIDLPLSALEAAGCGIPVVCTAYGELAELVGKGGFYRLDSFAPEELNPLLERAYIEKAETRRYALEYDWTAAVEALLSGDMDRR